MATNFLKISGRGGTNTLLNLIQKEEAGHQMELAANVLYNDYVNDIELPVFTLLDLEEFYETK
ncbi:MAG: hypothetical protein IPL23_15440 [Saprospiraceae bacterium]|nr:hypothetical protein [Saprospiraceae bacterium]